MAHHLDFERGDPVYLFGYGSLVSRRSTEQTLGRRLTDGDGPIRARLRGYRRSWSAGSNRESHPERTFVQADGTEFVGTVAVLGIDEAPEASCLGAVVRIRPADVAAMLVRERNYQLIDVSDRVCWPGKPDACSVHTFRPSEASRARLTRADLVVINENYARLVDEAFRALGPDDVRQYRESLAGAGEFPLVPLVAVYQERSGPVVDVQQSIAARPGRE